MIQETKPSEFKTKEKTAVNKDIKLIAEALFAVCGFLIVLPISIVMKGYKPAQPLSSLINMQIIYTGPETVLQGAEVDFSVSVQNFSSRTRSGDLWLTSRGPDGIEQRISKIILGGADNPMSLTVPASETVTISYQAVVPLDEPIGAHVVTAYLGNFPNQKLLNDSFDITIEGEGGGAPQIHSANLGAFLVQRGNIGFSILDYGGTYFRQGVHWSRIQHDNEDQWRWSEASRLQDIIDAGKKPIPSIQTNQNFWGVLDNPPDCTGGDMPPHDIQDTYNESYGYSEDFYNFVSAVAVRYGESIDYYVIGNEENAPNFWCGTPNEYLRTLATARKAIDDNDPGAKVADGGVASNAIGFAITKDILDNEGVDAAWDFYTTFYSTSWIGHKSTKEAMVDQINIGKAEEIEEMNYLWANLVEIGQATAANFHYYEVPQLTEQVAEFIKEKTGITDELLNNEYGSRAPDTWDQRERRSAKILVQKFVLAQKLGLKAALWFGDEHLEHFIIGFVNEDDQDENFGEPRWILVNTFETAIQLLDHDYSTYTDLSSGEIIRHQLTYQNSIVDVAWSEEAGNSIQKPQGCSAYDMEGNPISGSQIELEEWPRYIVCPAQ